MITKFINHNIMVKLECQLKNDKFAEYYTEYVKWIIGQI